MSIKWAGIVFILLTTVGCSTPVPAPTTVSQDEITIDIPKPQPLSLRDIEWNVIKTEDQTYFALTPKEYEELSLNMQDILRFIRESKAYSEAINNDRK